MDDSQIMGITKPTQDLFDKYFGKVARDRSWSCTLLIFQNSTKLFVSSVQKRC